MQNGLKRLEDNGVVQGSQGPMAVEFILSVQENQQLLADEKGYY